MKSKYIICLVDGHYSWMKQPGAKAYKYISENIITYIKKYDNDSKFHKVNNK